MGLHSFTTRIAERRFENRAIRITRREERNFFRRKLIPLAWAISAVGLMGFFIVGIYYLLYEEWPYQWNGILSGLVILPLILLALGWLRGHSNPRLEEP